MLVLRLISDSTVRWNEMKVYASIIENRNDVPIRVRFRNMSGKSQVLVVPARSRASILSRSKPVSV